MKRRALKIAAAVLVTATTGAALGAFAATGPSKLSTLLSSGVVSFGSAATTGNLANGIAPKNRITAGDTALWVDSFQNTGAAIGSGSLTQSWDPTRQTLQATSLKVPSGWTPSYTTDGITYGPTEPADLATVKGVQATAEFTPEAGKSGVVTRLTPPLISTVSTSISGGGDSYYPIFRKQNVYSVLHHAALKMTCFSKITGTTCGQVKPTKTLLTSDHADSWVNQSNGRAFTPAVEKRGLLANNVVLSCLDLDKSTDCGVAQIDTGATVLQGSYVSSPWMYANDVYFFYRKDATAALLVGCANITSLKPCAGQPYSAGTGYTVDGGWTASRSLNVYWSSDSVAPYRAGGRVSYTAVPTGSNLRNLECWDSAAHAACSGVTRVGWSDSQDPLPRLNVAGDLDGFCSRPGLTGALQCYDFTGAAMPVSPALEGWMPTGDLSWMSTLGGYGTAADSKSFMPVGSGGKGDVICFDWTTDATCSGFPMTTPLSKRTYSLREDPFAPSCIWSMGDDGILESVETHSGMSGCNMSTVTVAPSYCDGMAGHVKGWDVLKLNDLVGGHSGFSLSLDDANGNAIPGWTLKKYGAGTASIDISSVGYFGARTKLTAYILFVGLKPAAFTSAVPTIEVTWKGDPVQMCTKTLAVKVCPTVFVPLVPKAVAHRSDAVTVIGATKDTVGLDLTFDSLTPLSCAVSSLTLVTTVNGKRPPTAPGIDIRQGNAVNLSYAVTNTGATLIGSPTITDDFGTATAADDVTPLYASGDTNGNKIIDPNETWIFTAVGSQDTGQHQTNGVVTGKPLDATGLAIGGVPNAVTSDAAFYFISAPSVSLSASLYLGHNGGASCAAAGSTLYAPQNALITYCYIVVNTGNVALTTIRIADPALGVTQANLTVTSGDLASLAPGAIAVLSFQTTNSAPLKTSPVVTATPTSGPDVTEASATQRFVGPPVYPAT